MPLITMIFTDVVESSATKRDASFGRDNRERDRAYLEKVQTPHFELVRECCRAHGGREVSTMGDAFFLVFDDPTEAIRCAVNIQQKLTENTIQTPQGALRLRIGVHSGFPEYFEGSWHGTDVDTAARVEATATASQILMSSRTYELVRQMTDVKFRSRGEFALKGVDRMALWEVDWDGKGPRRTAIPPLAAGRRRQRSLQFAGVVAGTLVLVASGIYLYRSYKVGHVIMPTQARPAVAVMDFKNLGKPDVEWLSNALSEMLSTELGSTDALRTVSPDEVSVTKADLAVTIVPAFNSATLSKIRRILHSEYVISGAYVAAGNQPNDPIHIDVHVQDADSGETISSFAEDGTIGTLQEVLRKAGAELLARLGVQNTQASANPKATPALPSDPEALRLYSEGLAKLRVFDALGARDLLQRSVALAPDFALPHFGLARAWKLLGYDQQARDEAKKAVELSANLPAQDQRSIEAEYHELSAQWDQAIAIYQALWVLYPDEPSYGLALANAQTSAGNGQEALATLEKLGSEPQMKDDPRVDLSVALAAESLSDVHKQRDAAESAAEKAKRQESRLLAAQAYWQLCSAYYGLGEFEKGEAACNSSSSSAPFDDEIKARTETVLGNIMLAQGHSTEAMEMRKQALDTARKIGSQKDVIGALINLANLMDTEGNSSDARKSYEEAIAIARDIGDKQQLATLQFDLAGNYLTQGDYPQADQLYHQSLQNAREIGDQGGIASALQTLGLLSFQLGNLPDARRNVDEALKISQSSDLEDIEGLSLGTLGDIQLAQADLSGARKSYEGSLKLFMQRGDQPEAAGTHTSLAKLELEGGNAAESEKLARQAIEELQSGNLVDYQADAAGALAGALLAQDKVAEAQAEINTALGIAAQDRAVRLHLALIAAQVKARNGKVAEAQQSLEGSLREATELKLVGLELEIALARAEAKREADPKAASADLRAVEAEAKGKGYLLIAAEAARQLQSSAK
ncbi:MAG: tetratricopeptide repeat protein [Candidatus Acidiferrales bacterium]